jgi:signal transduction histidine kinase
MKRLFATALAVLTLPLPALATEPEMTRSDIRGLARLIVPAGKDAPGWAADIASALELPVEVEGMTRELEVRYPEPRLLRLHLARVPEASSAERTRRVVVLSDVTAERAQTEDRVESERIDSIMALAAGVAHEVGNPLNAIGIHLQLLQREAAKLGDSPAAQKVRQAAEVCRGEITRLQEPPAHRVGAKERGGGGGAPGGQREAVRPRLLSGSGPPHARVGNTF